MLKVVGTVKSLLQFPSWGRSRFSAERVCNSCDDYVDFVIKRQKVKAVKFALNALNEFNSNTNFSPRTTVFFKKCGNRKQSRYQLPHFLPHFHRIFTEFNRPKIKNFKF